MSEKTAAIIGATGMIGNYLTQLIVPDSYFDTLRLVVRRPIPKSSPKLEIKLVNFDDAESLKLSLEEVNAVFCAMGTTNKTVKGDKNLYRHIDLDIPLKTARFAKQAGCEKFVVITSVGANSQSNTFYLKLKGQLEEELEKIGFKSLHFFQPSLLLGDRPQDRPTERLMQGTMKVFSGLLFGGWKKYRAIHGKTVAKAMLNASKEDKEGVFRYTYDDIIKLAGA